MRSSIKHTRLDFEPLNISTSIQCATPASPLVQVSNALLDEYEPDRAITPCVIRPYIEIIDKDGIFPDGNANARLSIDSIKWFFNGVDITTIPAFAGKYEIITTSDELRGAIKIMRNIPVTEKYNITFEGKFEDWRRGKIETVQSNELSMFTTDVGEDLYRISVNTPHVLYKPILDNLLLYDFLVSNNIIPPGDRSAYKDEQSFERAVSMIISSGNNSLPSIPSGLTLELRVLGESTAIVPNSVQHPEVISITFPYIEFDLRLIEKNEYELRLLRGERQLAKASFSIRREDEPIFESYPTKGSDVSPHQEMYYNQALINLKDMTLTYPELYYKIMWFTEAMRYDSVLATWVSAGEVQHNIGQRLEIPLSDTGIGVTKNDNYFAVGFDAEPREAYALATDPGGDPYTDSSGNYLLI